MRVCIVSSWNEKCGIASYTKNLVQGLREKSFEVDVIGNFPKDKLEPDESFVRRMFHCPFMTNENNTDIAPLFLALQGYDVVHFQFETSLYHPEWFPQLIKSLNHFGYAPKIVFTMHSSGIWPNLDIRDVDHFISHEPMWCSEGGSGSVIPMGVKFYDEMDKESFQISFSSITSFGLGRNNDDLLKKAIEGTNIQYNPTYGHHKWRPIEELVKEIQKSWIISLLYPDIGSTGVSSSAVITAMGCNRPILITNTNWFKHVINYPGLYVCETPEDIKENINYLTNPDNIESINIDLQNMKSQLLSDGRTFDTFVDKHIKLYKNLTNKV